LNYETTSYRFVETSVIYKIVIDEK